jgi:putative DNA primase/helicase
VYESRRLRGVFKRIRVGWPAMPPNLIIDGALHRYKAEGDREANSWYIAHDDGAPTITLGCWKRGIKESKTIKTGVQPTPQRRAELEKKIEAEGIKRANDERIAHETARQTSSKILAKARQNPLENAYCKRKSVKAIGVYEAIEAAEYDCLKTDGERQQFAVRKGDLIVPIRKDGKVTSLQTIPSDGKKLFLTGGDIKGGCFRIGNVAGKITVCEGFATGASIHEATGDCVAVAFSAGNLLRLLNRSGPSIPTPS